MSAAPKATISTIVTLGIVALVVMSPVWVFLSLIAAFFAGFMWYGFYTIFR